MSDYISSTHFIRDFLSQPISPKDKYLHLNIHHKRLLRVIPSISEIIESFIQKMCKYHMITILTKIEENIKELSAELIFHKKKLG